MNWKVATSHIRNEFAVSVQSGEVKINPSEHSRFYLVNPTSNELQGLNISEKTREVIRKSVEG